MKTIKRMQAVMLLKNAIVTCAVTIATFNMVNAQSAKVYLKGESKQHVATNLVTGQYGDATIIPDGQKQTAPAKTQHDAGHSQAQSAGPANDGQFGKDKYLKTVEPGKRYEEFEVFDVNGMGMKDVMQGLLTNSLDRDKRYVEKGDAEQKVQVASGYIAKVDGKGEMVKNGEKVNVSAVRFNDKIFVILGENDYRYLDGKKLEGSPKLVNELLKGKPITETTFFYELKKAGIIDSSVTLVQFSKMNMIQKQNLMNGGSMVAAK